MIQAASQVCSNEAMQEKAGLCQTKQFLRPYAKQNLEIQVAENNKLPYIKVAQHQKTKPITLGYWPSRYYQLPATVFATSTSEYAPRKERLNEPRVKDTLLCRARPCPEPLKPLVQPSKQLHTV